MHSLSFTLNIGCVHADEPFDRHLAVIREHYEHLKPYEPIEPVKVLDHGLSADKLDV
jgi:hypothetical protein